MRWRSMQKSIPGMLARIYTPNTPVTLLKEVLFMSQPTIRSRLWEKGKGCPDGELQG